MEEGGIGEASCATPTLQVRLCCFLGQACKADKFLIGISRSSFHVPIDLRMLSGQARTLAQIRQHTSVPFSCCGVLSSSSRPLAWPAPQYKRPPWLLA